MPRFRMHNSMMQRPIQIHSQSDTGPHGQIKHRGEASPLPETHLAKHGGIHIGIKPHADTQRPAKRPHHIAPGPAGLGRGRDTSISFRAAAQIHRPKAADAQRLNLLILKPLHQRVQGFLRHGGRDSCTFKNHSRFIAHSAHHFGAAGLQRSDPHTDSFLSYPICRHKGHLAEVRRLVLPNNSQRSRFHNDFSRFCRERITCAQRIVRQQGNAFCIVFHPADRNALRRAAAGK